MVFNMTADLEYFVRLMNYFTCPTTEVKKNQICFLG